MASQTRKLIVEILGDAKHFAKAAKDADNDLDRIGKRAQIVGGAMMAAGGVMAVGLYRFAQAAADDERAAVSLGRTLENVTGATDDQVASVEDWITTTQNATGVLDDQLRPAFDRLVRSTRDVEEAQGLMQSALDISAGTGRDLEQVAMALGRAHDGNVTALGRLGIATRDAAGQTLSFDEIMANANETFGGQAAAAAGTTAGQMAILNARMETLKEEIGTAVIPVMLELADVAGNAIDWILDANEATDGWVGKLGVGATGVLLFGGAVTTVVGKLITMRDTLRTLADSNLSNWSRRNIAAIGGVTSVLAAATLAIQNHQEREALSEGRSNSYRDALRAQGDAVANLQAALEPVIADTDILAEAMANTGTTSADLASALINQGDEWGNLRDTLMEAAGSGFRGLDLVLDKTQDEIREARLEAENLAPVIDDVGGSAGRARPQIDALSTPVVQFRDNMREATQAIQLHIDKVAEWLGADLSYNEALRNTQDAVIAYRDAEGDVNDVFSDRASAGDDLIQSIADTATAYADAEGAVDGSREAVELQLDSLRAQRDFIPQELLPVIDEYIRRLESIPTDIDVNLNQRIRTFEETSASGPGQGGIRAPRAAGGPVLPGGSYLVGENGPELLQMGGATGYVHPNYGGGAPMTITIPVSIDGRQVAEALVRVGRNGGPVLV